MSHFRRFRRRLSAAALWTIAGMAAAAPAYASVTPVRGGHPASLVVAGRPASRGFARPAAVPLHYQLREAQASPAFQALPLPAPSKRAPVLPPLLPRFGMAALLAPIDATNCRAGESHALVAALPVSPFTPVSCVRSSATVNDWPTGFVAGHNKNALYGRAYSPRTDLTPQ